MLDELKELLRRQPFEPFRIVINSGDRYEVQNPQNVALGQAKLGIFPPGTDLWIVLRLNQIISLESAGQAA